MTATEIEIIKRNGERAWLYEEAQRRVGRAKLMLDSSFEGTAQNFMPNSDTALSLIQEAQALMQHRASLPPIN